MNDFPYGVTIGLGLVLIFTLSCIVYILMLDKIEENQSNVRVQDQKDRKNY
jgi:hypothetical protein